MKKSLLFFLVLFAFVLVGCSFGSSGSARHSGGMMMGGVNSSDEVYSDDVIGLPMVKESAIVELQDGDSYSISAEMVAKEIRGKKVKMLGYNGMIPGPFLKVKRGSTIKIQFTNNTDEEALFHSHGLRLDNAFDGTTLTQDPIPVGGSFEYILTFPDTGIYWYHPHLREDYTQEMGLYGNYLVQSEDPEYWSPVNRELPLLLDDILLENGKISPFYKDVTTHALLGRIGNIFLINGSEDYDLEVQEGEVVRFYVTNVANARFFTLRIPNAKMKLVGADASKYVQEEFVEKVLLAPSERAVIEVLFSDPGEYHLLNDISEGAQSMGKIKVSSGMLQTSYLEEFERLQAHQDVIDEIQAYEKYFDREPDKRLRMVMQMGMGSMMGGGMGMGGAGSRQMEMMMNEHTTTDTLTWKLIDMDTGQENMDIDWSFTQGEVVKLRVFNDPDVMHSMQHPIHLHGQRFLVLETNGQRNQQLAWKDTFTVLSGDTVDIIVDMSNPGSWMLHCHIAEHLEADMMLDFEVKPE